MNITLIKGWGEHVGDADGMQAIADALTAAGHTVSVQAWDFADADAVTGADAIIAYSLGMATAAWECERAGTWPKVWRVITGCPWWLWGEGGVWRLPDGTDAMAWNLSGTANWPQCFPLAAGTNIDCSADGFAHWDMPTNPRVVQGILASLLSGGAVNPATLQASDSAPPPVGGA